MSRFQTILMDIDGVLAARNNRVFRKVCNEVLRLQIAAETLESLTSMQAFRSLPEVLSYIEREGQSLFDLRCQFLDFHPTVLGACELIDDALSGVQEIRKHCENFGYCTARWMRDERWNSVLCNTTHIWLHESGFPHADQVMFCDGPLGKLKDIARQLAEEPGAVLLIDDSVELLMRDFARLACDDQALLTEHLAIGGFGYSGSVDLPLSVISLPSWDHSDLETFLAKIRREPNYVRLYRQPLHEPLPL